MMQLQSPPANQALETSFGRLIAPVRTRSRETDSILSKVLKSDSTVQTTKESLLDCCYESNDEFDVTNTKLDKMSFYKYSSTK